MRDESQYQSKNNMLIGTILVFFGVVLFIAAFNSNKTDSADIVVQAIVSTTYSILWAIVAMTAVISGVLLFKK